MKRSHVFFFIFFFTASFIFVLFLRRETSAPNVSPSLESENRFTDVVVDQAKLSDQPLPDVVEDEVEPEQTPVSLSQFSSALSSVPFTSQAPRAHWEQSVFQNGCEEASLAMAAYWISGIPLTKELAEQEILKLSAFEEKRFGHSVDTSAEDTAALFKDYYGFKTAETAYDISSDDIRQALYDGALVVVPTNGRKLGNPNFKSPGPLTHMLVVTGYDTEKGEFITNDPGTRKGQGYHYKERTLMGAIRDYPTGRHLSITAERSAMITIRKP